MRARVLWACLFLATPLHARQAAPDAPSGELRVKTEYSTRGAESALGNVYRGDYKAAMSLVADEDYTRAEADLQRISAACDPFARPGLRLVAVNDSIEYERYVRENPGMPVEWLDMVCPWTLKSIAFVRMEAGDARGGAGRTRQGDRTRSLLGRSPRRARLHPDPFGQARRRTCVLPRSDPSGRAIWQGYGRSRNGLARRRLRARGVACVGRGPRGLPSLPGNATGKPGGPQRTDLDRPAGSGRSIAGFTLIAGGLTAQHVIRALLRLVVSRFPDCHRLAALSLLR